MEGRTVLIIGGGSPGWDLGEGERAATCQLCTGRPFPQGLRDRERPVSRGALQEEKGPQGPELDRTRPTVTSCPNKSPKSKRVIPSPLSCRWRAFICVHRSLCLAVDVLLCRLFLISGVSPGTPRFSREPHGARAEKPQTHGEERR